MGIKSYFTGEIKLTLLFAVLGIVVGYVSFLLNNNLLSLAAMIVIAFVAREAIKRKRGIKEGFKWWLGNGLVVYVFLWLVTWIIFYNLALR